MLLKCWTRRGTSHQDVRFSICLAERIFLSQRCYKCYTSDGWWCRRCQSKYNQIHDSFMTIENDYNAGRCVGDTGTCWVQFRFSFHCTWRCSWRRSSGLSPKSWSCRCSVWKYWKFSTWSTRTEKCWKQQKILAVCKTSVLDWPWPCFPISKLRLVWQLPAQTRQRKVTAREMKQINILPYFNGTEKMKIRYA